MTQLQSILLDSLKDLISFFEENNISYFTCGGTTIGAVRHHGFIPWDDDIDLYVPRKDYDRMLSLRHNFDENKYKMMCIDDYPFHYPYTRFINQEYHIISAPDGLFHQGPFIDIIPLDEATDDIKQTKRLEHAYMRNAKGYRRCLLHKSLGFIIKSAFKGRFVASAFYLYRLLFFPHRHQQKYLKRFHQAEDEVRKVHGKYNFCYFHTYALEKELFPKEFFADYVEMPFESIKVRVPVMYHEYLTQLYGDYMQLPPENERRRHCDETKLVKVK